MIILGNQYNFLDFEIEQLKKNKNIDNIIFVEQSVDPKETIENLKKMIDEKKIKFIVLNLPKTATNELINFLTHLDFNDIQLLTLEKLMEDFLFKCYIPDEFTNLSFFQDIHHLNFFQLLQKRLIDIIGSLILLFISIPIILFSAFKIKKESPGNIFFKQSRVGLDGKTFTCIKFRSMHENSKHDPYTREKDPRIFPFGIFIRKSRIDELPQIINVLKGEMSIIGPRAEWDILVNEYEKEIPYYQERHLIKPGITGWAQVNFPYGKGVKDSIQKLMYDLYYIKNWSLLLEFKIILKTIFIVLTKKGT